MSFFRSFEEDVNEKYSKTRGHIASEFAEVSQLYPDLSFFFIHVIFRF